MVVVADRAPPHAPPNELATVLAIALVSPEAAAVARPLALAGPLEPAGAEPPCMHMAGQAGRQASVMAAEMRGNKSGA